MKTLRPRSGQALLLAAFTLSFGASLRAGEIVVREPGRTGGTVAPVVVAPALNSAPGAAVNSSSLSQGRAQAQFKANARLAAFRDQLAGGSFDNGMAARNSSGLGEKLRDAWNRIRGKDGPAPVGDDSEGLLAEQEGERLFVTVRAATREERTRAAENGLDIWNVNGNQVWGVAHRSAVARLNKAGLPVIKTQSMKSFNATAFPGQDAAYHDYAEMLSAMQALAASNPAVSLFSIGKSVEGRDIMAIRINTTEKGQAPSAKPGVVFMGAHHAREHLSVEVPLLLAQHLANAQDAETKNLLATRDVYIIPMVNPDGAEYDIAKGRYQMWRKSRKPNADGSFGVDLNRNYGYGWNTGGSSDNPSDDTYHGGAAFSEPETRAIRDFVSARPNLKVLLSYHTFSELILYPWGGKYDPIPDARDRNTFITMAETMAKWNGYKPEQSSELYIASGDTTDWAWGEKKIFSFTFELTPKSMWNGGFYPGAGVINSTFQANLKPALYLIGLADNPYKVLDGGNNGSSQ